MTYEYSEEIRAFLQEKRYLQNVSPKTILLYESCFKSFPALDEPAIRNRVVEMRTAGLSPVTVNTYLRHIKTFFLWKGLKWSLPWLKEEQKIIATLTPEQIRRLAAFKPKGINQTRTHTSALLILDGGYRVSELLTLPFEHCDFDNLVVKVRGKGGKHRLVPFSVEMRKTLFRYATKHSGPGRLMFGTRNRTPVTVRNFQRDLKLIGQKTGMTGVRFSPHTLRHSFACEYLRNGGNLYYLSRLLGHSSVKTTEIYLQSVNVDQLAAVHDRLSPLAPGRNESRVGVTPHYRRNMPNSPTFLEQVK